MNPVLETAPGSSFLCRAHGMWKCRRHAHRGQSRRLAPPRQAARRLGSLKDLVKRRDDQNDAGEQHISDGFHAFASLFLDASGDFAVLSPLVAAARRSHREDLLPGKIQAENLAGRAAPQLREIVFSRAR